MHITNKLPHLIIGGLILIFLLRLLGLVGFGFYEFLIYSMIIGGFGFSVFTIGRNLPTFLFLYSLIFLTGIVMLIFNSFIFTNESSAFIPATLFIFGGCFIVLFIDNNQKKLFAYTSFALVTISFILILFIRRFSLVDLSNSFLTLIIEQWLIFALISILLIFLLANRK